MKKLHFFILALFLFSVQIVTAQTENDPCSAPCLQFSGSVSGTNPAADGFMPNVNQPCGSGTSEDNPTWYTFVPSGSSFSINVTASGCTGGSGSIQVTFFEGDECGGVGAAGCLNCVTGGSLSLATTPCKQYWIQIDGCAEAVCNFTMTYDPNQLLKTVPPPVVTGPKSVCLGAIQTYTATIPGGCKPSDWTWSTQPTGKAVIINNGDGTADVKWTSAGNYKICAKPNFNLKCKPATIGQTCYDVSVYELKVAKCAVTLCCEDLPFDYPIGPCMKTTNPTITGAIDPAEYTIATGCGKTETKTIPYETAPDGCKGKIELTYTIKPKGIKSLPPMLICEDDSIKVGSVYLKCADAKAGIQNFAVEYSPHPTKCDTQYNFILQCIRINPIVSPQNPVLDCINTSVTLKAGASLFLPTSSAANPGVKSYLWSTNATTSDIVVTTAGTYCVTISYTYTLNTAQGSVTKTCTKVKCVTVTGGGATPPPPTPIALNPYPCLGDTASYTVSQSTGTTYDWTVTGGTPTAFTSQPVINVKWGNTPPYKVCAIAKNICGTSMPGCIDVTLNNGPATPVIKGPKPVCQNDSAFYSVTKLTTPGATYNWSVPPGVTIKGKKDSSAIKVMFGTTAQTGLFSVTVTDKCGSATGTLNVVVNQLPPAPTKITGKLKTCKNDIETYKVDSVAYALDYKWTVKGGTVVSSAGQNITVQWTKVAIDNELCVNATNNCDTVGKKYCITIQTDNIPTPSAGSSKSVCASDTLIATKLNASAVTVGNSGKWTLLSGTGTATFKSDSNPKTDVVVSQCGKYEFIWTESNPAGCSGKDTVEVTFSQNPKITPATFSCDPVAKTFKVSFNVVGCYPPFTLNGMGVVNQVLGVAPYTFTSANLPQAGNNVYTYSIQSGSCTANIKDSVNCNCITKAGEMDLGAVLTACSKGGKVKALHKDGTQKNDGNDTFAFALYEGTASAVTKIIALNKTGEFTFDAATMQCDKSYFVGYIMANDKVGLPDPVDPCFSITPQNQEVRWDCVPTPNAGVDQNICGLSANLSATPPPTGTTGKWKAVTNGTFSQLTTPTTTVTIAPPPGTYKFNWIETRGTCRDSASVNVTFKKGNLQNTPEKWTCDAQGENYTVKFDVSGGFPPYVILDCKTNALITTLTTAPYTFTSLLIKSGDPYCFKVADANKCDTIEVTKSYACGCISDAGKFQVDDVCAGTTMKAIRGNSDVLDANDTWEFLLTNNANPKDPAITIFDRNQTGEFNFDATKLLCDKEYNIILCVGNKTATGTSVKLDDPCLSVQVEKVKFICVPVPTTGIISIDTCARRILLTATPATNGSWIGTDAGGKVIDAANYQPSIFDPKAIATVATYGVYTFVWTASNGICKDSSKVIATLTSPSNLNGTETEVCANTNKTYILTIDLTGKAPFTIDAAANTASGKIVGNQFISDPIQSGKSVTVSIKDDVSCIPWTEKFDNTCPCDSKAGLMDNKLIERCEGQDVETNTPPNSGIFLDGDDTFEFYLHEGSATTLVNAIAHNKTGKFSFDATKMQYDKLYYVSYVVGDKKPNDEVDLNYSCKSISFGTPVVWHANPTAKIGTDQTLCKGSGADITIDLTGKASFEIFYKEGTQVAKPLVSVNNKYIFPTAPSSTTTYSFTKIIDANGCFADINKDIIITINNPPNAGVGTNGSRLCFGTDKLFTLSDDIVNADLGGTWSISPTAAGFDAVAGTFNSKNTAPGTYTFTYLVKGKKPCADASTNFKIIIDPIPVADAGTNKELNCDSRETVLGGASTKGPNIVYTWISSTALSNTNTLNPSTKSAGSFALEVKDTESGCSSRDTCVVKQDLNTVDSATFKIVQPNCFGEANGGIYVEKVFGGTPAYQFSINNGPFIPYKNFSNLKAGNYFMQVKDNKGCVWKDSVLINQPNEIDVDLGDDKDIDLGETADLDAQIGGFALNDLKKLIWYPQCDSCKALNLIVKPQETTLYGITVVNNKGCIAKDNILVRVKKPRHVFIPNIFHPDSESGTDDSRKVRVYCGLDVKLVHFFRVYDRWGDVIYEDLNFTREQVAQQNKGWDGRFREQRVQPGVYTYACKVEFVDGYIEIYKGDVLMILK